MSFIDKILEKFRKKPEKPVVQPIPGYNYWSYRKDLFDPKLTLDDIMARAGGRILHPPRYPKLGEVWTFTSCSKHGAEYTGYPIHILADEKWLGEHNYWPFLFCGCLLYKGMP